MSQLSLQQTIKVNFKVKVRVCSLPSRSQAQYINSPDGLSYTSLISCPENLLAHRHTSRTLIMQETRQAFY